MGLDMNDIPNAVLAVAAVIGAWIAIQQMVIARQKLNLDLFDRRYKLTSKHDASFKLPRSRDNQLRRKGRRSLPRSMRRGFYLTET